MRSWLSLSLLALLALSGCAKPEEPDSGSLMDMYDDAETNQSNDQTDVPYSRGPSGIPSSLKPHE